MGMSASQMRYVMITGEKTDVEYQGQQINQQRTTLATETSALNSQLLDITVPTPPSTDQFTQTSYSFTSGAGETCTVTGSKYNSVASTDPDGTVNQAGKWTINYTTTTKGDEGKISAKSTVQNVGGNFSINGNALNQVDLTSLTSGSTATSEDTTAYSDLLRICQDTGILKDATGNTIKNPTPAQAAGKFYSYTSDGTTKYALKSDLNGISPGNSSPEYTYYVDKNSTITTPNKLSNAEVTFSESKRMSSITVTDAAGNKIPYSLSVSTTNDNTAYQDAYNEYEYQRTNYQNKMDGINAKIDIVQANDKKLELKLQDLDTKQKALTTEMDSVKKVIDKNIESSYKTFA